MSSPAISSSASARRFSSIAAASAKICSALAVGGIHAEGFLNGSERAFPASFARLLRQPAMSTKAEPPAEVAETYAVRETVF